MDDSDGFGRDGVVGSSDGVRSSWHWTGAPGLGQEGAVPVAPRVSRHLKQPGPAKTRRGRTGEGREGKEHTVSGDGWMARLLTSPVRSWGWTGLLSKTK